jgi:hypothetical protein
MDDDDDYCSNTSKVVDFLQAIGSIPRLGRLGEGLAKSLANDYADLG